jgi:hypothetical protein
MDPLVHLAPRAALAAALLTACAPGEAGGVARPEAAVAPWFTDITRAAGIDFVQESGATGELHMPEIMGGGVAFLDGEGDGDLDLYLVNGNRELPGFEEDAQHANRYYRQEAPGSFADATEESGLGDRHYGMGAAVADADNDGDEDVYLTNYGPNRLFGNDGAGRFADAGERAGVAGGGWSTSAAFFDLDRDGLLDLYVCRYVEFDAGKDCFDNAGRADYCGPKAFPPVHDLLFRNSGAGVFRDATLASGIGAQAAAGLGVVCLDLDDDGWQDVYVANDAYPSFLWRNRGDGTFRDEALQRGAALNLNGQAQAGMGVVSADFDRDGRMDLFKTHLREETNTLYLNLGKAGFRDATGASGLGPASMRFTGFGTAALDFDRDEDVDLLVVNGAVFHGPRLPGVELPPPWDEFAEPNHLYLNDGRARFREESVLAGELASRVEISRGLAAGDVDGDGDPDLLLGNVAGLARLYRNDAPSSGHWLTVRCLDPRYSRDALGARVEVFFCGQSLVQVLGSSWSYLSSSPARAYFGLGACTAVERIEVRWPDGLHERFGGSPVNRVLELSRGSGES